MFYQTGAGQEPARVWLKSLSKADRKRIGTDIRTMQYSWPLGMPLVRKLEPRLWEARCRIGTGIARVVFTVVENRMVLLHGFVKKSQKRPKQNLETAKRRLSHLESDEFTMEKDDEDT